MSGIAGCTRRDAHGEVEAMLRQIAHRGPAGRAIRESADGTIGVVWTAAQESAGLALETELVVEDSAGTGRLARAAIGASGMMLTRDSLGVAPLYFARTEDGALYFASEVKALLPISRNIEYLPAGHRYDKDGLHAVSQLARQPFLTEEPEAVARELHDRLVTSVQQCITGSEFGCWLSGGLDSSVMAALARPHVSVLHTFAVGLDGASDLVYARRVADFLRSEHHEILVDVDRMLATLPDVINHLESFDALLVRSSIMNFLAGREAANYVPAVLSGEGGDELFAGYDYLKQLDPAVLADELVDITRRLQNTALQRVDRCSAAHGLLAHVPFLAPEVVDHALRIPVEYKLRGDVEKWILRQAAAGLLPPAVLERTKAKFWEGAGVGDLLAEHAESRISDSDFRLERYLPNGLTIRTKEELMYFRVFREYFGDLENLDWMGRTKGAPQS